MLARIYSLLVVLLCTISASVFACDYCLLTQGISPLETARGVGLRIDQRYTRLATLFDHGEKIGNNGALETHWTTQLTGFYSVTPHFTVTTVVPVVRRFGAEGEEGVHEEGDGTNNLFKHGSGTPSILHSGEGGSSFGLGDITFIGRYQFLNRHSLNSTFIAAFQAGLRAPTGKTDETLADGDFLDAHIQPGTGAFAYFFGLSTSYAVKNLTVVANGIFGIPSEGEVGNDTYEYGNFANYDASLRYRLNGGLQSKTSFFASVGVAGEYRKQEFQNGLPTIEGTGGHTVYLTPGVQLFMRSVILELSFWQPIVRDLNGEQLGETFKTSGGVTFLLR